VAVDHLVAFPRETGSRTQELGPEPPGPSTANANQASVFWKTAS
jgi:hypothetical protein